VALYRFLFAPVLLAVAVLTTSPRRAVPPAPHVAAAPQLTAVPTAHTPERAPRAVSSHPATVR
jgi:hypothetical protein